MSFVLVNKTDRTERYSIRCDRCGATTQEADVLRADIQKASRPTTSGSLGRCSPSYAAAASTSDTATSTCAQTAKPQERRKRNCRSLTWGRAIRNLGVRGSQDMRLYEYGRKHIVTKNTSNVKTELCRWDLHVKPSIGKLDIGQIRRGDVKQFRDELLAKPNGRGKTMSNSSVTQVIGLVRLALEDAVDNGLAQDNPAVGIKLRKERRVDEPWTYLSVDEQRRLIAAIDSVEAAIVVVALYTGLRLGELWSLRWEDVHADHLVVRYGGHGAPTKSGKPRIVPLVGPMAPAAFALGYWREFGYKGGGLVFPKANGHPRPTRPEGAAKAPSSWPKWLAAAGIKRPVRWHDLRHTCATSLVCNLWGMPSAWTMAEVSALLGHASTYVTARYGHLVDDLALRAAGRV